MNKYQYRFVRCAVTRLMESYPKLLIVEIDWKGVALVNGYKLPLQVRRQNQVEVSNEAKSWMVETELDERLYLELVEFYTSPSLRKCGSFKMKRNKG